MTATDNIVRYDCAIVNRLIFIFVRRGWSLGYYLVEKFGLYLLWKIHTLLDLQYKLEFIFLFQNTYLSFAPHLSSVDNSKI